MISVKGAVHPDAKFGSTLLLLMEGKDGRAYMEF